MRKFLTVVLFFVLLIGLTLGYSPGKEKKVVALGKYDFHHYYTYDELTNYLQDMVQAYPQLA
ncbi:hypothetical protein ACFLT2_07935, partial [Acidobacteriota bacterium]